MLVFFSLNSADPQARKYSTGPSILNVTSINSINAHVNVEIKTRHDHDCHHDAWMIAVKTIIKSMILAPFSHSISSIVINPCTVFGHETNMARYIPINPKEARVICDFLRRFSHTTVKIYIAALHTWIGK